MKNNGVETSLLLRFCEAILMLSALKRLKLVASLGISIASAIMTW